MKETKHYAAVILDVIDSRKFKDRYMIQSHLKAAVEICNRLFHDLLCKPVMFSAGDELQGLFYCSDAAYRYVAFFSRLAYPVALRCGIGFGELDFFSDWMSTELDGQAYHRARLALAQCHSEQGQGIIFYSERAQDSVVDGLIGSYMLLVQALKPKTTILYNFAEFLDSSLVPTWEALVLELDTLKAFLTQQQHLCVQTIPSYKPSFSLSLSEESFEEPAKIEFGVLLVQTWKRGLNGRIANTLGVRRQYVDAVVRTNNFVRLRYFEALIVAVLQEVK